MTRDDQSILETCLANGFANEIVRDGGDAGKAIHAPSPNGQVTEMQCIARDMGDGRRTAHNPATTDSQSLRRVVNSRFGLA
jgi:hypothetical protein